MRDEHLGNNRDDRQRNNGHGSFEEALTSENINNVQSAVWRRPTAGRQKIPHPQLAGVNRIGPSCIPSASPARDSRCGIRGVVPEKGDGTCKSEP
jgi:hypothetical protein